MMYNIKRNLLQAPRPARFVYLVVCVGPLYYLISPQNGARSISFHLLLEKIDKKNMLLSILKVP